MGIQRRQKKLAFLLSAILLIGLSHSRAAAAPTSLCACGTFGAGSYVVATNISSAGISCLTFNAGPVTVDLNGFTISSSTLVGNGVLAAGIDNVTVRNGAVKGFAR